MVFRSDLQLLFARAHATSRIVRIPQRTSSGWESAVVVRLRAAGDRRRGARWSGEAEMNEID